MWNGADAWEEIMVILKEEIDDRPARSTGHWCRLCRGSRRIEGRRLGSVAEAEEWLRATLANVPAEEAP